MEKASALQGLGRRFPSIWMKKSEEEFMDGNSGNREFWENVSQMREDNEINGIFQVFDWFY